MKSLVHLRMMIDANENGHAVFVRDVLNTLDVDKVAARPMLNTLAHMTREPIRSLPFEEEVDFFKRYDQLVTENVRNSLRDTNLNPGFSGEAEEEVTETEEEKRRRYLFTSLSEVSDVEFWQEVNHHDYDTDEEYEEIEVEEPEYEAPNRDDGPGAVEPEGEDSVDILELQQRGETMIDDINAIVRRMQARADEQEPNGDLVGALRTRDVIDGLLNR